MLTDDELDAVICADLATIYDLLRLDATVESFRESLRRIARACVNAAMEQAAQECDAVETELGAIDSDADYSDGDWSDIARHCAERVRLLKTKEQK